MDLDWTGSFQLNPFHTLVPTIKVLVKSDFSSDLTHFLAIIGGGGQSNMGVSALQCGRGGSGTPKEI